MEFDNETPVLSLDQNVSLRVRETARGTGKKKNDWERDGKGYYKNRKYKREKTTPVYSLLADFTHIAYCMRYK